MEIDLTYAVNVRANPIAFVLPYLSKGTIVTRKAYSYCRISIRFGVRIRRHYLPRAYFHRNAHVSVVGENK